MNQLNIQNMQKAQGGQSANVVDLLAQQLTLDPELAKVLQQGGENAEMAFDDLLTSTLKANPEALNGQSIKQSEINQLADLVMEKANQSQGQGQTQVKQSAIQNLNNEMSANDFAKLSQPKTQGVLPQNNQNLTELSGKTQLTEGQLSKLPQLNTTDAVKLQGQTIQPQEGMMNAEKPELAKLLKGENTFLKNKSPKLLNKDAEVIDFKSKLVQQNVQKPIQQNVQASMQANMQANVKNAYGMNKGQSFIAQNEVSEGLQATNTAPQTQSLQDIMFSGGQESSGFSQNFAEQAPQTQNLLNKSVDGASMASKTFNLNELAGTNSQDAVITKIQDYIVQSKVENQSSVELSFQHKDLGKIDLQVQKMDGEALNIKIATQTVDGAKFFNKNQTELLQSLGKAGIQVGEFKLESSQSSNNSSLSQDSSSQSGDGSSKQHAQSGNQKNQDSKRREELWNLYQERSKAAA